MSWLLSMYVPLLMDYDLKFYRSRRFFLVSNDAFPSPPEVFVELYLIRLKFPKFTYKYQNSVRVLKC
jgi:hypothetical protein